MTKTSTPAITTPLYLAYVAAQETLDAAVAAREALDADESVAGDDPRYIAACEAEEAAEAARDAALEAYVDSDEPREWHLIEDGYHYSTVVGTRDEAIAEAQSETGDYDTSAGTVWTDIHVTCELTGESADVTVQIDPEEPSCVGDEDHDWQAPHVLVGGIEENPGVWGHGGGVIIHEACLRCGCGRTTDTWAQRPDTGEQGLTSVSYELGQYDLDDLGYVVEERVVLTDDERTALDDIVDWHIDGRTIAIDIGEGEDAAAVIDQIDQALQASPLRVVLGHQGHIAIYGAYRYVVIDRSDDTLTIAADEDDAREIAYRCRAGHARDYEWQDAEDA